MAKSWQEKFDAKPHHDIKVIEKDFWGQKGGIPHAHSKPQNDSGLFRRF